MKHRKRRRETVKECCGSRGSRHLKTCAHHRPLHYQSHKPERPKMQQKPMTLQEATDNLIEAACAYRDHDWANKDGSMLVEALDVAVDEYRRSLDASNKEPQQ